MDNSKVSILIPVYNREKLISETLESALNQSYKNLEIIIVDNASTDRTQEIIKSYAVLDDRIKLFINDENIGPVKNWVKCLEYSTGEYVKFLWSDDLIDNDFIEKTITYFSDNSVGFVYSKVILIDEDSVKKYNLYNISEKDTFITTKQFIERSITHKKMPVSPGCAIFRRVDVLKNLILDIPNNEKLNFCKYGAGNDQLIFLLTALDYSKAVYVNSTHSYFRAHSGSFTISTDLELYYMYGIIFFLQKSNNVKYKKSYKAYLILKTFRSEKYKQINACLNVKPSISELVILIANFIKTKSIKLGRFKINH